MRKIAIVAVCLLFFLAACSAESRLAQDEVAQLFVAMSAGHEYAETTFRGAEAEAIADLVATECPDATGEFVRATYTGSGASLIVYAETSSYEVICTIWKMDAVVVDEQTGGPAGVAAAVNGVPITLEQIENTLAQLPEEQQDSASALNSLINDELLRQAAASAEGDDEETRLSNMLEERLLTSQIAVTNATALEYYLENTNQFVRSEQAVMRHILLAANRGDIEQASAELAERLTTDDFCDLVEEYSDDRQESCGLYVVPRGILHPDLEFASFNTPDGQTSIVTTEVGVHFVQTIEVIPPQVTPYEDVAGELQSLLVNTVFQERLNVFLQMLRADAEVIVYL